MTTTPQPTWEAALAECWSRIDHFSAVEFRQHISDIVSDPAVPAPVAAFEQGYALTATGRTDLAIDYFAQALDAGLTGERARHAIIHMAGAYRVSGRPEAAIRILQPLAHTPHGDGLDDVIISYLALALTDAGKATQAVYHLATALADHLPHYRAAVKRQAGRYRCAAAEPLANHHQNHHTP